MNPPPHATYLFFDLHQDEETAALRFEKRFGRPPEFIYEHKRELRLGPVPAQFAINYHPAFSVNSVDSVANRKESP